MANNDEVIYEGPNKLEVVIMHYENYSSAVVSFKSYNRTISLEKNELLEVANHLENNSDSGLTKLIVPRDEISEFSQALRKAAEII